jgi:hypothetical protein
VRTRARRVLPRHDWNEVHAIELAATPEAAVAALLATPVAPPSARPRAVPAARAPGRSDRGGDGGNGFVVLRRTWDEIVLGAAGRPWTRRQIRALADARDGDVRLAVDVRATESRAGRCSLSTETRVQATDAASRRGFGRYWRVVGPFSAPPVAAGCRHGSARNGSTRRCERGSGRPSTPPVPIALPDAASPAPAPGARRRHRDLGLHVRPRAEGGRRLPALRIPRRPVRDLDRRPRAVRPAVAAALPRVGWGAGIPAGTFLALAYGLQTAGLELTTVTSTGFITALRGVTPLLASPPSDARCRRPSGSAWCSR